ncbi:MAG: hypothetical protein CMO34_07940 [Verrucomicrobia bacterium]|nr:hypothetical protein [Verrucomicrobiota bacterium]
MEREDHFYGLSEDNDLENPVFEPHDDYGDLMTVSDFKECVECGGFIDYDGHGVLATLEEQSDILVWPSTSKELNYEFPEWATHVRWYNR